MKRWTRVIGKWAGWLLGAVVTVVTVVAAGLVVCGGLAIIFGDNRTPEVVSAGSSLVVAGATLGLLVGSVLAAWYLWRQVAETRRAGQNTLRPVVSLVDAWTYDYGNTRVWDRPLRVRLQNIGPGPAISIDVQGWRRAGKPSEPDPTDEGFGAFLQSEGERLPAAPAIHAHVAALASGRARTVTLEDDDALMGDPLPPSWGRLHYRITYRDIYERTFVTPHKDELPAVRSFFLRTEPQPDQTLDP